MDEQNRESNPNQYSESNFQEEHEMGQTAADMNIQMEEMGPEYVEEMEAINEEEEDLNCAGGAPEPFREAAAQVRKPPNSGGQKSSNQGKAGGGTDLNSNI